MEIALNQGLSDLFYSHRKLHFDHWFEEFAADGREMTSADVSNQRIALLDDAQEFCQMLFQALQIIVDPIVLVDDYLIRLSKPN